MALRRKRKVYAPTSRLARQVQGVLSKDLILPRYRGGDCEFDGHCYAASEAYFHLAGGEASGLQPMQLSDAGTSHWWLRTESGDIIDLTMGPDDGSSDWHYDDGRPRRFLKGNARGGLSWRAAEIVER